jgi:Maltooligosyl trehalose synthase
VTGFYNSFVGSSATLADIRYERKKQVMDQLFTGEMLELGSDLAELAVGDRYARDLSPKDLRQSLVEITACMPVYRTYASRARSVIVTGASFRSPAMKRGAATRS